uniref:Subtilisin-like protease SBT1.7 n=1 Tax=Ananas comosus var. bracteatus TaxID=296719 RepID=A0A6V7NUN8_ANACO|nr:unnamed protein product [Ananas comosus var. bracteatus]
MNYPSIQVSLPSRVGSTVTVSRTVTNVGDPRSVYTARITAPQLMRVDLSTYRLRFSRLYEEASFDVALTVIRPPSGFVPPKYAAGKIEWVSGNRVVKTPIAVNACASDIFSAWVHKERYKYSIFDNNKIFRSGFVGTFPLPCSSPCADLCRVYLYIYISSTCGEPYPTCSPSSSSSFPSIVIVRSRAKMKSRQRLALLTAFSSLLPIVAIVHAQLFPIVNEPNADSNVLQTYIVNVDKPLGADSFGAHELRSYHESFLPTPTLDSGAPRLIYSYRDVMSGFAARLTPAEVADMESKPGFVHARVDQVHPLLTTYTPEFMGLTQQNSAAWASAGFGQGIVIGILDTGIHPTHPSFDPAGMPPPPPNWRGNCSLASGVWCNNKIIAARGFNNSVDATALDTNGHGTHVASTAAGNSLDNANVLGRAFGTATGMAPRAHLAIYKVCFENGCATSNTLAAIDQAIYDGVDIISMSIGGNATYRYYYDGIAQGSLAALSHGIIAVAAAGNEGPAENTLAHDAPWVLTVGAASTDRRCRAIVKLGNGEELEGETAYQPSSFNQSRVLPIVYPGRSPATMQCYA